jgi:hypothetical protein
MACRDFYETKDCILAAGCLPPPDPGAHFTDKHRIVLEWPHGDQPLRAHFIPNHRQPTPGKCNKCNDARPLGCRKSVLSSLPSPGCCVAADEERFLAYVDSRPQTRELGGD